VHTVRILDSRSDSTLAGHVALCDTAWTRFRGLMLQRSLPAGHGLLLSPCGSVHTALMLFAIDVIYLDKQGKIVKLVPNLQPFRISFGGWSAHSTIELPAGTLAKLDIRTGDVLRIADQAGEEEQP
jgi:uncharacterized membrane protein (UPF0127 family)